MTIQYDNFIFNNDVINTITQHNVQFGSYEFNDNLHNFKINNKQIIELLKSLRNENINTVSTLSQERKLNLTIKEQENIVIDFYTSINSIFGEQVYKIINNLDNRYVYNITTTQNTAGTMTYFRGTPKKIDVEIKTDGSILGLRNFAHEIAHAISQSRKSLYTLSNSNQSLQSMFTHLGQFDVDCIGEIESYIIEYLFMDYLVSKNIATQHDYDLFLNSRKISFNKCLDYIIDENYILDNLPKDSNMQDLKCFVQKIKSKSSNLYDRLMKRLIFIYKRKNSLGLSQYHFRYVIGEIVSSNWFEQYLKSNQQEKQEMTNQFISYLSKTDTVNLQDACQHLLNMEIDQTFETYQQNRINLTTI